MSCISKYQVMLFTLAMSLIGCDKFDPITKVTTDSVTVKSSLVMAQGNFIDVSVDGVDIYGHCWSKSSNPTLDAEGGSEVLSTHFEGLDSNHFTSMIRGIELNAQYYIRTYSISNGEVSYGNVESFKISDFSTLRIDCQYPYLRTSGDRAMISAYAQNLNSLRIVDFGYCWARTPSPTVLDSIFSLGVVDSSNTFDSTILNLTRDSVYYIRAYAILNTETVIYGSGKRFVYKDLELSTNNFFERTESILLTGNIQGLASKSILNHGHVWSISSQIPDTNDNLISMGALERNGYFESEIFEIQPTLSNYSYRSFIVESDKSVTYGELKNFTL